MTLKTFSAMAKSGFSKFVADSCGRGIGRYTVYHVTAECKKT